MRLKSLIAYLFFCQPLVAQVVDSNKLWHKKERVIHYKPAGNDFVCVNGKMRFNRALYGTNTGFRVEAGDLPEFALYMPGMGGNFKFGLIKADQSKWLIHTQTIKATYRAGSMLYDIRDPLLGNGNLLITVLALGAAEGMIIKTEFVNVNTEVELLWAFGGASGKKFSRDGDIGADPESSFYLQPEYCRDNRYGVQRNTFHLTYGTGKILTEEERYETDHLSSKAKQDSGNKNPAKHLMGIVPSLSDIHLADATQQDNPLALYQSGIVAAPVLTGKMKISNGVNYFLVQNPAGTGEKINTSVEKLYEEAETARKKIAGRIKIATPDDWINTLGASLSIAADAIWEDPTYLHGAVAWRMRLNAWRGAYVADPLGWHDRARRHFSSYALSQITTPPVTGVVMDTSLHLARHQEKIGTALFSDGYICRNPNGDIRAHHYDMNLVFVDQLLNHFNWTGDTSYVREMWPLIKRHLAWEKRNFDADGDGLYDAYAAIWASDALQYSGGGVTHSSAYNYRANKRAAELAQLIGEDGTMYRSEADRIFAAIQKNLWLPGQGSYAEYKDLLGNKLVHPSPGLWTIYHAIDSRLPDQFQAYLNLRYIDTEIPQIPVTAKGLPGKGMFVLSTTNWQPYTWSINNVALAENLHTALAYWQGNRSEEGYRLWRSTIIESMYLGASPGGFQQLSFYDAVRGELYRDFADGIGMAGRSLVEGLFGVRPDALHDTLTIQPGYPAAWNYARLQTPDIHFDFKRKENTDTYFINVFFNKALRLKLLLAAFKDDIAEVTVNGSGVNWSVVTGTVGKPLLQIDAPAANEYIVSIQWKGKSIAHPRYNPVVKAPVNFQVIFPGMQSLEVYDPQESIRVIHLNPGDLYASVAGYTGNKTFFVRVKQGAFTWWQPIEIAVKSVKENKPLNKYVITKNSVFEKVSLTSRFNDKLTNIFTHSYLSPRPSSPTLQLPTQGIGNWCYPLAIATIDDIGLRTLAGNRDEIRSLEGIPFSTPSDTTLNNIIFVSNWDNFRNVDVIGLTGKANYAHLLMAGSTNPMQSRVTNGMIYINYADGGRQGFALSNPENWWPIEQDYLIDGYAFTTGAEFPERLYLKDGKFGKGLNSYSSIRGYSNRVVEGGAATVLHIPLDPGRELSSIQFNAVVNDVVIGLMSVTLQKN